MVKFSDEPWAPPKMLPAGTNPRSTDFETGPPNSAWTLPYWSQPAGLPPPPPPPPPDASVGATFWVGSPAVVGWPPPPPPPAACVAALLLPQAAIAADRMTMGIRIRRMPW